MPSPPLKITVLGSGTSVGVPTIGCHCAVCTSTDPRDNRLRPSILVSYEGRNVLIDTTPDFRTQALRAGIEPAGCRGLHARPRRSHHGAGRRAAVQLPAEGTDSDLRRARNHGGHPAQFSVHFRRHAEGIQRSASGRPADPTAPFDLFGLEFLPVPVLHGRQTILRLPLRRGGLPDRSQRHSRILHGAAARAWTCCFWTRCATSRIRRIPRWTGPSKTVDRLEPRRAFFTHICHDLGHERAESLLPPHIRLAYDGLEILVEAAP